MTVIDQVVTHQSLSTLVMMSLLIGVAMLSETLLGYARRQLILIVGARVDAKLNLHVFQRLLRLPLDYFERNQAGYIWSMTGPADQQDPRIPHRQTADHNAGPGDLGRAAADPFLPAAGSVLDGSARRRPDRRHHRCIHEANEPPREALDRRGNGKVERHGGDLARHPHRQVARPGAAAKRALGRTGCRSNPGEDRRRPLRQSSADTHHPDRGLHAARRAAGRRLHHLVRSRNGGRRRPRRLHDAERPCRPAAGQPGEADGRHRRGPHRDCAGSLGAEPASRIG